MKLSELSREEIKQIAAKVKTHVDYLNQMRAGKRIPSPRMAKKIEEAADHKVTRMELLYPDEF